MVRLLLRVEGIAVFALCTYAYGVADGRWLWFILLFLVPDVALLVYVANRNVGVSVYNLVHTYSLVVILLALGLTLGATTATLAALILGAHVGLDRFVGFGLKYPGSKETHLQRV